MHRNQVILANQSRRFHLGIILRLTDNAHLGAKIPDPVHLDAGHQLRHADHGAHAETLRRVGNGAPVIASRDSHHAPRTLLLAQIEKMIAGGTDLERARIVHYLELEIHARICEPGERTG